MKKFLSPKIILGLLVLLVILLSGAIFFLFQNIKSENENASDLQNSINISTKQNQYSISLQESLQNASSSIAKINNSILSSDADVGFIEKIEDAAKGSGLAVVIDSLSVEDIPNVTSDNLTSLWIRVRVQGDWAATMVFISKLESFPFIIRMEKFDLTNSSDNPIGVPAPSTAQTWQTTFEIRVLQYK
jgi:Tfp pilus assembly protein PilO